MATQQEVIKNFMKYLDTTNLKGEKALNAAIKYATNSTFTTFKNLKAAMINDMKNAKSADNFLKTYCGINLDNKDTGAITGSDAGGSKVKTASSIVPEEGSLIEFNDGDYFDNIKGQDGLAVQLVKRTGSLEDSLNNIATRKFSELSKQEIYLWRSIYTWWIRNGLALIAESYGENFSFDKNKSSATNKNRTLYIIFEDLGDNGLNAETWYDSKKKNENLIIRINLNYFKNATGKDGIGDDNTYLDRIIAHELTHAVMSANINYYSYLPAMIREGMAELTQGISDDYKNDIKKLASNSSLLSQSLSLETTASKVKVSGVSNPAYAGGYMFLRYLARQMSDFTIENTKDKSVQTFYGNDYITNFVSNSKVITGAGKDTIHVGSAAKKVTIDSGTGDDFINNWAASSRITTGTGNDTVHNSSISSGTYISTGAGNDSISNYGSKVTINGGAGSDYISNYASSVTIDGGADNDKIYNHASKKVTINGGAGDDGIYNWGGAASMVGGAGNDVIWGDSGADTIRGGADNDKLHGDAGNDRIYGDSGNDTLWGEAGNDSLWGGTGNDTFIYTANQGTDIIFDYAKGDMLQILKADGSKGSFKGSKYSGGDLTLTITGGGKVIFDNVAKSTQFNINSTNYKISGTKLKK